ncbi:roadblock/LC7 domain-containing protein [Halioxenophilus sp. WMMB6]|uniref:roadblock/LC7 domain-containing protein n=1 Tax=Halioxenophilus sp. WMMB6 TaxID=3073815 RepID=UPI00295EBCC1|nr:roadblock/LC7 domain-containing protein [Halioxenophilus sp. WMMB6]
MSEKKQIVIKKQDVETNLTRLLQSNEGIYAALLSSVDGHALAKQSKRDFSDSRLAAMTSSCLALGEKMALEAQQAGCNFVIIQNQDGFMVLRRVGDKLVISTMATKNVNLGLVLSATNAVAVELEKAIQN